MNDLRPSEIIHIEDDVLDTNDVKRTVAIRIIEQHGWVGTASFDAELGVHSHYSIEDVREFLRY